MKKRIKVTKKTNGKYCSGECPFMADIIFCYLYDENILDRDETGNLLRPQECLDADDNPVVDIEVNSYNSDYCGWQCPYFNRDAEDCVDRMTPVCNLTHDELWIDNDGCRRCDFCLDGEKGR